MTDTPPHGPKRHYLKDEPNPAADLIRTKIAKLYKHEPDAVNETLEAVQLPAKERSPHQKFMYELSSSGKGLDEIQTAWHQYYIGLSDKQKHEVWQEFYAANHHQAGPAAQQPEVLPAQPVFSSFEPVKTAPKPVSVPRSIADLKKQITHKVKNRRKLNRKQHIQSLAFGLSIGALTVAILLFGLFNERVIAPFITPSRDVSATPLILGPDSNTVSAEAKVVVPKINLEVPVVYDVPTIEESAVQKGLERGTVHYATTANPGEKGNAVIFGHSSNNILNHGKYKFAFVLLNRLEVGDTFYLHKDGTRYIYKIFEKKIVRPTDISVLAPVAGKVATATLITCDPPGTSVNRLIVVGEQISPDPSANQASSALATDQTPEVLAGNAPSLWSRFVNWIF
jgi:sortase A